MTDVIISQEENVINPREEDKIISNVNVKQCILTIIFSAIMLLLAFIPFTFGDGFKFTYEFLPVIGNGDLIADPVNLKAGLVFLLKLDQSIIDILGLGLQYFAIAFFGIVAFDLVAALFLAIFRANPLRVVFKVLSIIFGFVMIVIALFGIVYILGIIGYSVSLASSGDINAIVSYIETSGILLAFLITIMACFMAIKQFRWFAKLW